MDLYIAWQFCLSWDLPSALSRGKLSALFLLFTTWISFSDIVLVAPSHPVIVNSQPTSSNLLYVSIEPWADGSPADKSRVLLATTADRRMNLLRLDPDFTLISSSSSIQDSPILSCATIGGKAPWTISGGMSGSVLLYDHGTSTILEERRDHRKYVVKVALHEAQERFMVCTAAWDGKVFVYSLDKLSKPLLGAPFASLDLPTNPETITFIRGRGGAEDLLMITRRDSTSLHYYGFPDFDGSKSDPQEMHHIASQNLAPYSNAWIAFSPSSVAICPTDPTLLAVATSSIPHMKIILVQLLVPNTKAPQRRDSVKSTQAAQTRADLAIQDREDAAIQINVSTMAPQTPYSIPQVCWRPDGSGVWVNGDDGVLRGIEAKTGKVVAKLKDGHEAGSKIRSLWAGMVEVDGKKEEWVVSGGFDRRLVVWKPQN